MCRDVRWTVGVQLTPFDPRAAPTPGPAHGRAGEATRNRADARARIGTLVGEYRITDLLGEGGAGAVYKATHEASGRACAVKLMLPHWVDAPVMVRRFEREIEVLQAVQHPSIVEILARGALADGTLYYAMPLLEGHDIDALLARRGRLSGREFATLAIQVCEALAAAHAVGVIHRDLKPSNVFVTTGSPPLVKLLDFGVARFDPSWGRDGLTALGTPVGTPLSMAPEQVLGLEVDARTDIYAAGILFYVMLTGSYPFEGASVEEVMQAQLLAPVPPPGELVPLAAELERVALRCLEKRPERRFASADELKAALLAASAPAPTSGAEAVPAVAIAIAITITHDTDEDLVIDGLEVASETLTEAGYEIALGTGDGILAVRWVDPVGAVEAAHRGWRHARTIGRGLADEFEPSLRFRAVVHSVEASGGRGAFGCPGLLDVDAWAGPDGPPGVVFSEAAADVIGEARTLEP